ncbi:serine/threonine-protein kinase [Streptomyces sp. NPDC019396]|uniref:serine/threonine-protein kinase n=1 Tax=Streptomyces sp. NPDC019396 TaxID=3154687 RepID=UPI0033CB689D
MNAPGDVIDARFELIEPLGSGGMGTVWRARDTVLHREVALKAVRSDAGASAAVRERVLREARALARISHPHVVTIHHIVDADPHPWIVMELVPGDSLQQRLSQGPMAPDEAARIGRQVLSGLSAAHAAGIQHRDVKPANVLLRNGVSAGPGAESPPVAVLTDFGIAALEGTTSLTMTGELVGSPEYIAPERIRGHDRDNPASDLWSLGLVLYVCAEGVSPLRRDSTLATLAAVLDDPVPPPARSGPLAPVLEALLVRDPAARPVAGELDAMLARVEAGGTPDWSRPTVTGLVPPVPGAARTAPPTPPTPPVPTQLDSPRPTVPEDPHPTVPSGKRQREGERERRRMPVAIAAIAVAVAVTAATALALTLREQGQGATKEDARGPAAVTPAGTASATPAPSSPAPLSSGPAPPSAPVATPTPSPSAAPPDEALTPSGRWIAQLFSEPVSSGTTARDQRLAAVRTTVPEADVLRSDDYASLRPGYWVVYAPGPFTSGASALVFCAERGRTTANACIGRYLSTRADDYGFQCRPPADNPTGQCYRLSS